MRIVQVANFVTPRSGGLHTAVDALGRGYQLAGHDRVLVVPGARDEREDTPAGPVIRLRGPLVPGSGGYRVIPDRARLHRLLGELAPDRLEVSDRSTLRWLGGWARDRGVPSVVISHERLDAVLGSWLPGWLPVRRAADASNGALARGFDRVVCTTSWALREFTRLGVTNASQVPLGVDLDTFRPARHDPVLRAQLARDDEVLLVHCSRLSKEKRPDLPLAMIAALRRRGVPARLVVAGDGPQRRALERAAADLPVTFLGFLPERDRVAALLATADIVVAPGPVETFGLAALEAMACGTPVIVSCRGALPEMVTPGSGLVACGRGSAMAQAVVRLLALDPAHRRASARGRAEDFPWSASVDGMLRAHRLAA